MFVSWKSSAVKSESVIGGSTVLSGRYLEAYFENDWLHPTRSIHSLRVSVLITPKHGIPSNINAENIPKYQKDSFPAFLLSQNTLEFCSVVA